jgi:predicted dithiol-disulfide oxidoreductase (DUF899 family)
MTTRTTGTREEWLARRLELLEAEKNLTYARGLDGLVGAGLVLIARAAGPA